MYRVNQPSKNWGLEKKNDVILRSGSRRGGYTKSGAGKGGGGSKQSEIACKIRSTVVCNNLAEWNKFKSLQTVTGMLHVLKFMENGSIEPFFPI